MVASTACCEPCHQDSPFAAAVIGDRNIDVHVCQANIAGDSPPPAREEGLGMLAHRKSHMLPCGRRAGQGDPGRRTCAVRLAAANGGVVAAKRGRVVMAPSTQLRLGRR